MPPSIPEGSVLWTPSAERVEAARITAFGRWLEGRTGTSFASYDELWRFSVGEVEAFWRSVLDYFEVPHDGDPSLVLRERRMPGAEWFPDVRLNYAEVALRRRDGAPALIAVREDGWRRELSFAEVGEQVASVAAALRELGVGRGDRVASCLPNIPEAAVAFLACASIGAVWSSCSPDFGIRSIVDRFSQIEPKLLLCVDGYLYNGRRVPRLDELAQLQRELPSVETTILVDYLDPGRSAPNGPGRTLVWPELLGREVPLSAERLPFSHPLWILYSSGTTGLPKGIVHGHGGIVLEHLKAHALQWDLGPEDRLYWFTSTGWMMWNAVVGLLLVGCGAVLYDGSPSHPDLGATWRLAEQEGVTYFGTSPPFVGACARAGVSPRREADLSKVRTVGSAGSPLSPEGFAWLYEHVGDHVLLYCGSGGTDVCSAFVGNLPVLPVYAGEMAAPCLGVAAAAFDPAGRPVVGEVGELVIREPMPSMPVFLWNDPDGSRLQASYFEIYPGVWRHGDWIRFTERGSSVITGRSDATLNRDGVRMGTADFYRVLEELPEIVDSLIVDTGGRLWLFVVPAEGVELGPELERRIRQTIREALSPRHEPDEVRAAPGVPRTLNGKKLEVPVKAILVGADPERAVNRGAVSEPETLDFFIALADAIRAGGASGPGAVASAR